MTGGRSDIWADTVFASAEQLNPTSGSWSALPDMTVGRDNHTLTTLCDGRVLAVGGLGGSPQLSELSSAETYNKGPGSWLPTGSLAVARSHHTATRLLDGRVLVVGGSSAASAQSSEIYTP